MDTEIYKAKLLTEKEIVQTELEGIAVLNETTGDWEAVPSEPADEADSNEAADVAEESTERQAMVADLETRFLNINRALDKISNGTYGTCELCEKPIETARLEANPSARTCVADMERENELPN